MVVRAVLGFVLSISVRMCILIVSRKGAPAQPPVRLRCTCPQRHPTTSTSQVPNLKFGLITLMDPTPENHSNPLSDPPPRRSTCSTNVQKRVLEGAEDSTQPQTKKKTRSKAPVPENNTSESTPTATVLPKPTARKVKKKATSNDASQASQDSMTVLQVANPSPQFAPEQVVHPISNVATVLPSPNGTTTMEAHAPSQPVTKKQSMRKKNNSEVAQKGIYSITIMCPFANGLYLRV
jgi:hypothetical protein